MTDIDRLAEELWQARRSGELRRHSKTPIESLSMTSAYDVQDAFVVRRLARPDTVVGRKVGCTSAAIRSQFGLDQPVAARIFRSEVHASGVQLRAADFVDCAVEAELVFRIGDGAPVAVAAAVELHHYRFFHGAPTSQELVAGNALQAGVVIGPWSELGAVGDITSVVTELFVNGEEVATGVARDVMDGGPKLSLEWLGRHLADRGESLRDGDVVLPGSAVPLVRVAAGDVIESRANGLTSCTMSLA